MPTLLFWIQRNFIMKSRTFCRFEELLGKSHKNSELSDSLHSTPEWEPWNWGWVNYSPLAKSFLLPVVKWPVSSTIFNRRKKSEEQWYFVHMKITWNSNFTGTQLHPFVDILSKAALIPRWQDWVAAGVYSLQSLQYLPSGPLQKKCAGSCYTLWSCNFEHLGVML